MRPNRVSNPGPLTYESGALPTALRGPAPPRIMTVAYKALTLLCEPAWALLGHAYKKEYLVIILDKTYVVTPHLNHLDETVLMRGHNVCFNEE